MLGLVDIILTVHRGFHSRFPTFLQGEDFGRIDLGGNVDGSIRRGYREPGKAICSTSLTLSAHWARASINGFVCAHSPYLQGSPPRR